MVKRLIPGSRFLAVEVKAPGGRLSPEQKQFLAEIRELGGLALVVKSWQEIDSALRQAGFISDGPLFEEPRSEAETAENAKGIRRGQARPQRCTA
jgi:hypothetical protein